MQARTRVFAVAAALALVCGLLHGSALWGGWYFDDPPQLRFVARYSPWQYFAVPEVMREQSYAHITPWNALFYEIGLPFFGMNPAGHHLHLLLVLWATAVATWRLLRRPFGERAAFAAALLFLAMPPTAAIAQMLMTGHYAYGLLFTVLCLLFFLRALEHGRRRDLAVAALAYAMACLCKELYVPLLAVVLMLPVGTWRQRLRLGLPLIAVGIGYAVMRLWVLEGVGGYAQLSAKGGPALASAAQAGTLLLQGLRRMVFGEGAFGVAALCLVLLALLATVRSWRQRPLPFLAVSVFILLAPVAPMFLFSFPYGQERLMLFIGWSVAVGAAACLSVQPRVWPLLLLAGAALVVGQRGLLDHYSGRDTPQAAENTFITQRPANEVLVPFQFLSMAYLDALAEATQRISGRAPPVILQDDESLVALGPERGRLAWAWREACKCIERLGKDYDVRVDDFRQRVARGAGQAADVGLRLDHEGVYRIFSWTAQAPSGSRLRLDIPHFGRLTLPLEGKTVFGLDTTAHFGDAVHVRISIELPDGALVRSPLLTMTMKSSASLSWRGAGTLPP